MKKYICPMHPGVAGKKGDKCPECGMKLVPVDEAKNHESAGNLGVKGWKGYIPLIIIVGIILLLSIGTSLLADFSIRHLISNFMIGFFLAFATFKLLDLKGFAEGYSTYDLLAQRWYGYGLIYPFIELFFAVSMLLNFQINLVLWLEILVMGFSGVGVAIKLAKGEKFQCSCLGTFLKVPLTKITLVEDFGMVILAVILLIIN